MNAFTSSSFKIPSFGSKTHAWMIGELNGSFGSFNVSKRRRCTSSFLLKLMHCWITFNSTKRRYCCSGSDIASNSLRCKWYPYYMPLYE